MGGIVDAIVDIVETVVDFVVDVVETVVDFVGDVIGFVINPFGAFDTPQVDDPGAAAQGVTITKTGTNNPIPVVYGHRQVGGNIVFVETNGSSNKYLYVVYAFAEGEIEGVKRIFVDDTQLPAPSSTVYGTGVQTVSSGIFKNRMKFQILRGTDSQGESSLANEAATWKNKRRRLPGIAYAVFRYEWKKVETQEDADNNPYRGGIPTVKFNVLGKKVYDVRTHSGSGAQLSATYANLPKKYSFNPANCLLDYLMNPRYGVGISRDRIDANTFKIAANKYEQRVDYSNSQRGRAMTMNAVVNTSARCLDNVKTLVAGARGILPYVQGRYKLKVEDGGNATDITSTSVEIAYDVDSSVVVGGISLDGERKKTKYNQVIVNYVDPDLDFSNQQVVYNVAGDQTIDQDEELSGEFTFHTLTNPAIARDLAQMIYDKSRTQRQIAFTASQELMDIEVGDIIRVTDTVLDLNLDTFRVVAVKLRNNGQVEIQAVEHDATLYPFTTGAQVETPPPLYLPNTFYIKPFVQPLPNNPTSVVPVFDPDYDSAGTIIEIVDDTTPPSPPVEDVEDTTVIDPPSPPPPPPDPTVRDFENFEITYDGNYYGGNAGLPGNFDNAGFEARGDHGLAHWVHPGYGYYNIFGLAASQGVIGTQCSAAIAFIAPTNREINGFSIDLYNFRGVRIGGGGYGLPNGSMPGQGTNKFDTFTGLAHPTRLVPNLGVPATRIRFRWTKDGGPTLGGLEFPDGSNLSQYGFGNFTYLSPDGKSLTNNNIEAFLNYLNDFIHGEQTAQTNLSFSSNLGA